MAIYPEKYPGFVSCFFIEYGGELSAHVNDSSFRRSPIPQGGLEIPITLSVDQAETPKAVFEKMKGFIKENYIEPNQIPSEKDNFEVMEI